MFGFTDYEMDSYRDLAQDFAVTEVTPNITKRAQYIVPVYEVDGQKVASKAYLDYMVNDLEKIITFTTAHMAYEYASMQCDFDWDEADIINHLHNKYEDYLVVQFIKYGLGFTLDILNEIVGSIILELPYLYVSVIEDDTFDEDEFLEEKLDAYNEYMKDMQGEAEDAESEDGESDGF